MERDHLTILRGDRQGRLGRKIEAAVHRSPGSEELEATVVAEKGSQETFSTQGQGCSGEGDGGRNSCAPENESPSGKLMEKNPHGVDLEYDGEKDGSLSVTVDSSGREIRDYVQAREKAKSLSRDSGLKITWARAEDEGEDVIRAVRSVFSAGEGRGNNDGTRNASSGRERTHRHDSQAEKLFGSSQILGEGRGPGQILIPGLGFCRVLGSTSDLRQISRAIQCPGYNKWAHSNGLTQYEPISLNAQAETLKTGMTQELVSTSAENSEMSERISGSSEAGQEGKASHHGVEDELRKDAAQAEEHNHKKRYDDNTITQVTPIPFSVFGRPLLSGGFSGRGASLMEEVLPLRVVATDGREWGSESPGGIRDEGEETDVIGQRNEGQCGALDDWSYGSWESSCLVKFSEFLGFPTKGFEQEILNLLRNLVASQKMCKGKGTMTVSKSERELRRLMCTVNYDGNKSNKGGGRDRENFLLKLK